MKTIALAFLAFLSANSLFAAIPSTKHPSETTLYAPVSVPVLVSGNRADR